MKGFTLVFLLILSIQCLAQTPSQSAVVSSDPKITQAGMETLSQGGNAFDAAVAMATVITQMQGKTLSGTWVIKDARASEPRFTAVNSKLPLTTLVISSDSKQIQVKETKPLVSQYEDIKIITASNQSGIATILALKILSQFEMHDLSDADQKHLVIESLRRANCKILTQNPRTSDLNAILSDQEVEKLRDSIKMNQATSSLSCAKPLQAMQSYHYSVLDKQGNQVAASIVLNEDNIYSAPLLLDMKEGIGSLGTTGGHQEAAVLVQSLLTALDDYYPQTWMLAPRFAPTISGVVEYEKALPVPLRNGLRLRGYQLQETKDFGDVQGIFWETKNNKVYAASDIRGKGLALVKKM